MKIKILLFVSVIIWIISGCSSQNNSMPTETLDIPGSATLIPTIEIAATITATFQPTTTSTPSKSSDATNTPRPVTDTPVSPIDLRPVSATCIGNSNVRSWPSKGGDELGGLMYGTPVQVLARNPSGNWYLINYKSSPTGQGWVKSNAIAMKGYADLLPIAFVNENHDLSFIAPIRWTIFGTPLPLPTLSSGFTLKLATVTQSAEVRVCPTIYCMIIAYVKKGDQIILDGKEGMNDWVRFDYPSGPDGIGWISTRFITSDPAAYSDLPYFDELGTPVTPEQATTTPDPNVSPTPTLTATATPAGPLAEITGISDVYSQQSSFSIIIGTLQSGDKINITRESLNHLWFEIQYPANSTGRGYISSKYVRKLGDFRYITYTDSNGTPVPTP